MAKKISELAAATTPLTTADLFAVVQGGVTKRVAAGLIAGLFPVMAKATHSANLTISDSVFTDLPCDTTLYEVGGEIHNPAANNARLTAPVAGWYVCGASVLYSFNATGRRLLRLMKNGTVILARDDKQAVTTSGGGTGLGVSSVVRLEAGDYITAQTFQDRGGDLILTAAAEYSPQIWMARVAA